MWRQSQLKQRTLVPSSQDKEQLKKYVLAMGTKLISLVISYYLFQNLVLRFKLSINRISICIHF